MRIAVIGASGWLGGAVAREAIHRGHQVTAIGRHASSLADIDGATVAVADLDDPESVRRAVAGSDVVVASVTDRTTGDRSRIPNTARALLELLPRAGVGRLAFVGGGGSLEIEPGLRVVDTPGFPPEYRNEALAQAEALHVLRSSDTPVEWTYLSPPPHLLEPGPKTGIYTVASGDAPVVNAEGESRITSGDFAAVLVDELEQNRFARQRFTASS
jgi:putative NADH-flavin reductase